MRIISYTAYTLALLSILPYISCGNKQDHTTGRENHSDSIKTIKSEKPDSNQQKPADYKLEPYEAIIKPAQSEFKEIFGGKYKSRDIETSEIPAAEKLFKECFNDEKRGTVNHLLDRNPEEYNRQFVGAADSAGNKIIWINCFVKPEKPNEEWKSKLIIAMGGGTSFFNLKVNISTNTYFDLIVNGNK